MAQWATFLGFVGVILVLLLGLARASTAVLSDTAPSPDVPTSVDEASDSTKEAIDSVDEPGDSTEDTLDSAADAVELADGRPDPSVDQPAAIGNQPPSSSVDDWPVSGNGSDIDTELEARVESDVETEPDAELEAKPNGDRNPEPSEKSETEIELSTPALLANVAVSQGLFFVLLVTMAWYTEIPPRAFGLAADTLTLGGVGLGVAVGVVFYGCNEAVAAVGRRRGFATPTALREALAPETAAGWAVLLVVVLPVIAGFEELLFRGALIGVVNAGFGVSPWLLAVGSSVAFALGHGAQGRVGIVVTGILGLGLAAVFVLTESLLVVIVAHYVINAAEFVVHEGVDPSTVAG